MSVVIAGTSVMEPAMGDVLKFLQPAAGYRWACDQRARRQGVIDQLLRDAVLHIQTTSTAEQDRQRESGKE
jgi:hypothetical protein